MKNKNLSGSYKGTCVKLSSSKEFKPKPDREKPFQTPQKDVNQGPT